MYSRHQGAEVGYVDAGAAGALGHIIPEPVGHAGGLLIRRTIANGDMAFFSTWCPRRTAIEILVKIEGHRWAIEDAFKTTKNELGLDHNETRSWHGWHRHVSLVMLAFAMMAAIRHHANAVPPPKTRRHTPNSPDR